MTHGWLVLDKPQGLTSARAVSKVKRIFGAAKAGHGGTLDPLATGVLPIAMGEATKVMSFVLDAAKAYRATIRWGEARDTDDMEGAVIAVSDVRPEATAIEAALPAFVGRIEQVPPAYSALKVAGRRAYAAARAGETVALEPRLVEIAAIDLKETGPDWAEIEVFCGKGTYIRALARDLARALGTVGHLAALRRTRAGPFHEKQAFSLETLEQFGHSARRAETLLPLETALDDIPALALSGEDAARLRRGQTVSVSSGIRDGIALVRTGNSPVAMVEARGGRLQPVRVFNL